MTPEGPASPIRRLSGAEKPPPKPEDTGTDAPSVKPPNDELILPISA